MNSLFKIVILIFFSSSFSFATADGPDHYDVKSVVANDVLWMHPKPDYHSQKIAKIPYNATCLKNLGCTGNVSFAEYQKMSPKAQEQLKNRSSWCKVNYQGTIGWVNGKFLRESGSCLEHNRPSNIVHKKITIQMLEGQVMQTEQFGTGLTMKFLPPRFKSFDGDIVFHFNSNSNDDNEFLSYRLMDGKIVYYGNDGSKSRLTLLSKDHGKWIMLEEEDIDGDNKQFNYSKAVKKVFTVKNTDVVQKNVAPALSTPSDEKIDQLMMQIYGRMDTRIASRRDHIQSINGFLHTASLLLIKKHKLDIQMQEFRRHQMAAVGTPPKVIGLMNALGSIEKLDGTTILDHNGNKLTTITELKDTYGKAVKESIQMQRDNYSSEKTRESDFSKLEEILIKSGSAEQKNDMKKSEIMRLKGEYTYYKKLLDNASVWCFADRDVSQRKPLFYPKTFIIELLYDKYEAELYRSGKPYDAKDLLERVKKIEAKSKTRKHQFNQDFLYDIRTKPNRLENKFQ